MPWFGGKRVTITDVGKNTVTIKHIRGKNETRLPGADTTVPHQHDSGKVIDYKEIEKVKAKELGLLGKLFGRGTDIDPDEDPPDEPGGWGLHIRF